MKTYSVSPEGREPAGSQVLRHLQQAMRPLRERPPEDHLTQEQEVLIAGLLGAVAIPTLTISSLIIPERNVSDGVLIRATSDLWGDVVRRLGSDWSEAFQLKPEQWEELVAGAFKKSGFDEVTLTPRSGDHGRDVIAIRHGIGCVKIIGSVKAHKPGTLVDYDAIRSLIGVMSGERDVSKGIITTTSDFPPRVGEDPFIRPFMPTRLELINGKNLQKWLTELNLSAGA
jgi:restriction system protein